MGAPKGENSRRVASIRGAKGEMFWCVGPHLRDTRAKLSGPKLAETEIANRDCGVRAGRLFTRFVQYKNIRRESDRSQAAELNTFTRVGTAHLLSCSIVRESTATRLPPSPSVRYAARRVETLHVLCVLSCAPALHVHADLCGGWQREKRM